MKQRTRTSASTLSEKERESDLFTVVESRLASVQAVLEGMRTYTAYPGQDLLDCIRFVEEATEYLWQMHHLCERTIEQLDGSRDQIGSNL